MGWYTPVLIINDQLGEITGDPQRFVDRLHDVAAGGSSPTIGVPGAYMLAPSHADTFRLLSIGSAGLVELSPYAKATIALAARSPAARSLVEGLIDKAESQLRDLRRQIAIGWSP